MSDRPHFGELSRPYPQAARAFRLDEHQLTPINDPAISHGLTDAGQARRFVEKHGPDIRYDRTRKLFYNWQGHYWAPDREGHPIRCAIEMARELYLEAAFETNLKTREMIAKFAIQQQGRRKIEDVLELAKALPPIAESGDRWNADPFLIATPWGLVDLKSGNFRDGKPDDRITLSANAKHDPLAECPRWRSFLLEVFCGDADLAAYAQRAVGYSATGDTREQVIFLCFGAGANGKSSFLDTIAYVLGEYSYACPFSTFEAGQRSEIGADLAALAGRRFVTSSETNTRSRFNEARLKALSGGDRMNARHLYGNPFEFHPQAKIWLGVNHKPAVADDSYGFWRRMHLIPFTQTFSGSAEDRGLKATLRAEANGILNWIIEGALAWQRDGLAPPAAVLAATDNYRHEEDPLAEFIEEACIVGADIRCPSAQLFAAYVAWSHAQGVKELSRKTFGLLMGKRVESRHCEFGKLYIGIGVRS